MKWSTREMHQHRRMNLILSMPPSSSESGSESELVFVKGIDYRSVFEQCPAALGIAALDGRILECNTEFQTLLGFSRRDDLMKQSLFNLVRNHQDIFRAMAQMLKTAEEPQKTEPLANTAPAPSNDKSDPNTEMNADTKENAISKDRFWTGPVTSKLDAKVSSTRFHYCLAFFVFVFCISSLLSSISRLL